MSGSPWARFVVLTRSMALPVTFAWNLAKLSFAHFRLR